MADITYGGVANSLSTLARAFLAGQPNVAQTGVGGLVEEASAQAQGLLEQEHMEKIQKEQEEQSEGGIIGKILGAASVIPGPQQPFVAAGAGVAGAVEGFSGGDAEAGIASVFKAAKGFGEGTGLIVDPDLAEAEAEAFRLQKDLSEFEVDQDPEGYAALKSEHDEFVREMAGLETGNMSMSDRKIVERILKGEALSLDDVDYNVDLSTTFRDLENL